MLMGSRLLRLGAHPRGKKAPHRGEIQDGVEKAGPRLFQVAEHRVLDGVADVPLLRHRIDQPERFGLARVDRLAGQHQRHRLHRIDQMRETRGAAEAGMQAEHHLGKAKARAVDRDARLAGQRHFEPAAEAETVNHRDGRDLQAFEAVDHRMGPADRRLDNSGIGGAAEFVDVGAGNEAGCLRRANDNPDRPLAFQRRQHLIQFFDDICRQRIGAGAGAIEQQPRDAVGVAGELEIAIGPGAQAWARVRARDRRERP